MRCVLFALYFTSNAINRISHNAKQSETFQRFASYRQDPLHQQEVRVCLCQGQRAGLVDVQDDKFKAGAKQFLLQMPEVSICSI